MEFEWDENKNQKNIEKHGISFDIAKFVFEDYDAIEIYDDLHSQDEDRYIIIGMVGDVLYVVYTMRKEKIRLISARLADNDERRLYYDYKSLY
ncbi:MAG: BrnT family toxin [Lachnospiraceae bacterium]